MTASELTAGPRSAARGCGPRGAPAKQARLLLIVTRLIRGGAQREVLELLRGLDRRRFHVSLACHPEGEWVERGAALADAFHPMPHLVRPISPARDLLATLELAGAIRRGRFDIVHTHTSKAGIVGRVAARLAGVPVIVHTPHGTVYRKAYLSQMMQRIVFSVERTVTRWTGRVITKSEAEADEYVRLGLAPRSKFQTIHAGLDLEALDRVWSGPSEVRQALGLNGRPAVLYAARFVPEKDHTTFLRALEVVLESIPHAVALLAGEGPLEQGIVARASDLVDRKALLSLGFRDDLPDIMRAADVCVSASLTEGLPLMVTEALALGRPVVATDAGGTREVVRNGETGLLVPCGNAEALAEGILWMIRNPEEAAWMGQTGREHVRPLFDARLMVKRIEDLYEECLTRKGLLTRAVPERIGLE